MASNTLTTTRTTKQPIIDVSITPTIERDYRERGAFPDIRAENAAQIVNGATGIHRLSIEQAETILKDAEERHQTMSRSVATRGLRHAYCSLFERLGDDIRRAKGLWADPGEKEISARMSAGSALFRVGEKVRYWSEWNDDPDDGARMVVSGEYALRKVHSEGGAFVDADGERFDYRWGYLAVRRDGSGPSEFFYPALNLQTLDCKQGHLRLVVTNKRTEAHARH
jgi:hypothetical protein